MHSMWPCIPAEPPRAHCSDHHQRRERCSSAAVSRLLVAQRLAQVREQPPPRQQDTIRLPESTCCRDWRRCMRHKCFRYPPTRVRRRIHRRVKQREGQPLRTELAAVAVAAGARWQPSSPSSSHPSDPERSITLLTFAVPRVARLVLTRGRRPRRCHLRCSRLDTTWLVRPSAKWQQRPHRLALLPRSQPATRCAHLRHLLLQQPRPLRHLPPRLPRWATWLSRTMQSICSSHPCRPQLSLWSHEGCVSSFACMLICGQYTRLLLREWRADWFFLS